MSTQRDIKGMEIFSIFLDFSLELRNVKFSIEAHVIREFFNNRFYCMLGGKSTLILSSLVSCKNDGKLFQASLQSFHSALRFVINFQKLFLL